MLQEARTEDSGASVMSFGKQVYAYDISNDVTLSSMDKLRDLGVTMSAGLSRKAHIKKIVSKAHSSDFLVMSVFGSRDDDALQELCKQ